jgi:hypothetical protein
VLTAAFLFIAAPGPAAAGPDGDVSQIRQEYLQAKKLYKQKKYDAAIKAFSRIRAKRYHPILDYRIGTCHEAMKRFKLATAYYRVYIKLYNKGYPVGRNHPKPADVKKRIKAMAQVEDPPVTPAPAEAASMPTAPSEQPKSTKAQQAQYAPYTEAPPPGYETAPPPPPPGYGYRRRRRRRYRRTFPRWRSFYITGDFGAAGLSGDTKDDLGFEAGGGAWAGFFYRPLLFFSAGLVVGGHGFRPEDEADTMGFESYGQLFSGLELRGHLPLTAYSWQPWYFELWGGVSAGYAHTFLEGTNWADPTSPENITTEFTGYFVGAALGIDLYLSHWFSIGALVRVVKPGYDGLVVDGEEIDGVEEDDLPDDIVLYGGVSATLHFYLL